MKLNMKKEEDKKNITQTTAFSFCKEYFTSIDICLFFFLVLILIMQLVFKQSSIILSFITAIIPLAYFIIFKEAIDKKSKKIGFFIFKVEMFLSACVVINSLMLSLFLGISESFDFTYFIYIIDLGVLFLIIVILSGEGFSKFFASINEINVLENLDGSNEIKPGDAVLGHKVNLKTGEETDKPVILPLKDRFLHMLILGPTGCGKTSQSIIPMINRDMGNLDAGITVLEPKGDLAEKVYAMAKYYQRDVLYFNPILKDCPFFNPLEGDETDVIENMATTFNMLNPDSPQFFKDMTDNLIRKGVKLLKRWKGDDATLIDLNTLLWNTNNEGTLIVKDFKLNHVDPNPTIQKENDELVSWFLTDYYAGIGGGKGAPKTYENCSGVRTQVSKLISNKYLRKVLNPPASGTPEYFESQNIPRINFDETLEKGTIVAMSTAQGALRELGRYLGYFIILQLQASVFRRPGNEDTRKHNMLFIDEFQVYANPGFGDMLTMGRSYRIACHLATQARAQIGMGSGRDGDNFVKLVSTNARNKIIYPGVSAEDAKYYSDEFGEILEKKVKTSKARQIMGGMLDQRITEAEDEELKARFSPTDIIYKPFGQITYCIIKNNSISEPGVSRIQYIDADLNKIINKMVEEYNAEQLYTKNSTVPSYTPSEPVISTPEDIKVRTPEETSPVPSFNIPTPIPDEPDMSEIDEDITLDVDDM